jgi:hypothetical protein
MAELIPMQTTSAISADFTLTDAQSTTIFLKKAVGDGVYGDANASIQIKSNDGQYFSIASLDVGNPALVLQAAGTFRVYKFPSSVAHGVDRS